MWQGHYFFFVLFNCPSPLCSLAPGNLSSVTPPAAAFLLLLHFALTCLSVCLSFRLPGLQELPEKWTNVHKQATLVKQQVAPLQAIEVGSLRRKCALFDVEQHTFRESFRTSGPFR